MFSALALTLLLQTAPTPAPTPKPVGAVPSFDVTGAALVVHDVASGWHNPHLSLGALALGPHYGPFYVGGTILFQSTDGTTSAGVAYVSYVGQGYHKGWFRGVVISFGQKAVSSSGPNDHGFWFGIGVGKQ